MSKAEGIMLRVAAAHSDNGEHHENAHEQGFAATKPEFGGTIDFHSEYIDNTIEDGVNTFCFF